MFCSDSDLLYHSNLLRYSGIDYVASFSSIEHSGLGRYGDPVNPFADVLEIEKISCLLKPGGLLYIGLPTGKDIVMYNAHRIYGLIRWPMIIAGFEPFGVFHNTVETSTTKIDTETYYTNYVFVLKKY